VSTENHSSDCTDEASASGSPTDGELQATQQNVGEAAQSSPVSTAAATDASSGLGQQTAGPAQGAANELQGEGQPDGDHAHYLAETLDLLRASVEYLVAKKRRTTAAAVSLEMRRRSDNSFTPAAAGFATFRDFLRFAEGVGAVTLLPPVPGGDMEVLSATVEGALTEPAPPKTAAPRPIRRDLWQAFVDWSPQRQRAFDVLTGRVVTLPTNKPGSGDNDADDPLAPWREDPERFRRIIPLSRNDQLQWMRTFVSQLPPGQERDGLQAALDADHPLSAFVETIRELPDVERSWRHTFTEEVTSAITRWMRQERLTVDIYHMPSTLGGEPARHNRAAGSRANTSAEQPTLVPHADSADELRRQVLDAVARMSLSELLRLPIPAEYLLLR